MKIYFNIKANDGNKRRQTIDKRRPDTVFIYMYYF